MASKTPYSAITVKSAAKKLGQLGGKVGGPARARVLSAGERSAIARQGARAAAAKGRRKG